MGGSGPVWATFPGLCWFPAWRWVLLLGFSAPESAQCCREAVPVQSNERSISSVVWDAFHFHLFYNIHLSVQQFWTRQKETVPSLP